MKRRRVLLIEFSIYDQYPLVSGYMHGYAAKDPDVSTAFEFVYHNEEVERVDYERTLRRIRASGATILCFSCYVWNMGLVKRLVTELSQDPSIEKIVLGGHQVSHNIHRYVDPENTKTFVINGQGEIPFRALMQAFVEGGEVQSIRGVSRYLEGSLQPGGEGEMLKEIDDIPSPFLSGLFDGMSHPITIVETNRGCPYKCSFCTWGGDTTAVRKFPLERVQEELRWIAKRSVLFLYIGDANWGMLPRDIELSEFIARLKKEHGFPWMVYYAAAKNKPQGSVACIEKFYEGGVVTTQALGIQSMNPNTLSLTSRGNIRNSAYVEMFRQLEARNIDSYCELMWPLPGETIDTLKNGFEQLVDLGARTTIMYPVLLINNASMTDHVAEFEIDATVSDDWKSELRRVRKTKFADRGSVDDGFWFYYAYFLLGNCDLHKALLRYVKTATNKSYGEVVTEYAAHLRENAGTSPYARLIESFFDDDSHGSLLTIGRIAEHLTHGARLAAQRDVIRFLTTTGLLGSPETALVLAGLWAFSLPRLFAETRDEVEEVVAALDGSAPGLRFSDLAAVKSSSSGVELEVRDGFAAWNQVTRFFHPNAPDDVRRVHIKHVNGHMNYNQRDATRNFVYAHGMVQRLGHIAARFEVSAS